MDSWKIRFDSTLVQFLYGYKASLLQALFDLDDRDVPFGAVTSR